MPQELKRWKRCCWCSHQIKAEDIRWYKMTSDDIRWQQLTEDDRRRQQKRLKPEFQNCNRIVPESGKQLFTFNFHVEYPYQAKINTMCLFFYNIFEAKIHGHHIPIPSSKICICLVVCHHTSLWHWLLFIYR